MPDFVLGKDVHENVRALRVAMGSRVKPLSRDDLGAWIAERHPDGRKPNGSTVQRWEEDVDPDVVSIAIMASEAGTSFEAFALGSSYRVTTADGETSIVDATANEVVVAGPVPPPRKSRAASASTKRQRGTR